jgi:hypothetical protein
LTHPFDYAREELSGNIRVVRTERLTTGTSTFLFSPEGKLLHADTQRQSLELFNKLREAAGFPAVPHFHMEFEDFPVADMPALPEGFEDHSWHNDMCPSFEHPGRGLQIWVDYLDRELREFPESPRFAVFFTRGGADNIGERISDTDVFSAEEWPEVETWLAVRADEERKAVLTRELAGNMAEAVGELARAASAIFRLYEDAPDNLANEVQPEAETEEVFPASIDEWCLSINALKEAWALKALAPAPAKAEAV